MSKKHYEAIAKIIYEFLPLNKETETFVDVLAEFMEGDNPLFDKGRFLAACWAGDVKD